MDPDSQSGKYQCNMDTLVSTYNEFEYVNLPPGKRKHNNMPFKVSLVYESFADEIRCNRDVIRTVENTRWPQCYYESRAVLNHGANGVVIPLALYTDGV
eukprot:6310235-Pyramimonas_sp.AAC.1